MHHKASAFVLGDLHCKALPVERIPLTRLPRGGGPGRGPVGKGQRVRRVRWPLIDSSNPHRSPLVRRLFYLLRRAFTYIFEASSCFPLSLPSTDSTLNSVLRFLFIPRYAPLTSADHRDRRKSGISRATFLVGFRVAFSLSTLAYV